MSQAATKEDLKVLGTDLRGEIKTLGSNLRDEIRENTRDIISHFNGSQGQQNEWMKEQFLVVNTKLDAIMSGEVLVTRKQLDRLVRALKTQGIKLDEAEIFRS